MCYVCGHLSSEVHECARCGTFFCLDCGYLRKNETAEEDWLCYECDVEVANE